MQIWCRNDYLHEFTRFNVNLSGVIKAFYKEGIFFSFFPISFPHPFFAKNQIVFLRIGKSPSVIIDFDLESLIEIWISNLTTPGRSPRESAVRITPTSLQSEITLSVNDYDLKCCMKRGFWEITISGRSTQKTRYGLHKSTKLLGHGIDEYSFKVCTEFKTKRRRILM